MKPFALILTVLSFIPGVLFGQCNPLSGNAHAFGFNIPDGVTVVSVELEIDNYDFDGPPREGSYNSTTDLESNQTEIHNHHRFDYDLLWNDSIIGPSYQNLQIFSGLAPFWGCYAVGDAVSFDWVVTIEAIGEDGEVLNYSGPYTGGLSDPVQLGAVYNGLNIVSGSFDLEVTGTNLLYYRDMDNDGFGDENAIPIEACFCSPLFTVPNNLDCDDTNPDINPDQTEIPNNGIDEDCDGMDLTTAIHEAENQTFKIYPNPAQDLIYIQSSDQVNYTTLLYDLNGALIHTATNPSVVSVASLPEGIYILKIQNFESGKITVEKIVKRN